MIALGLITIVLPESVIIGVLAGVAVLLIVIGGIMLSYGNRVHTDEELVDVDATRGAASIGIEPRSAPRRFG